MNGEGGTLGQAWRNIPESVTAGWATSAAMGPEPWIRFFDRLAAGDTEGCEAVLADIEGVALPIPDFSQFACYNTQLEKARIDAAGYMRCDRRGRRIRISLRTGGSCRDQRFGLGRALQALPESGR